MDALRQFSIPLKSIEKKTHQFDFQVDSEFFSHFENSLIKEGKFDVVVEINKKPNVMDVKFIINGSFQTECDRCLAGISQKVEGEHEILAKFGELPEEENPEVIYIQPLAHDFNVAKYIYEFICLSIPYTKVCVGDDEELCDQTVQGYLGINEDEGNSSNEEAPKNPFLDALKDFNQDI